MRKKWNFWDIVVLALEILSPLVAIIITCFIPVGQSISPDNRLAIMGAGISIPVVLLQISMTQGQNKAEGDVQKLTDEVNDLIEKLNHINPVLEQTFISGNERLQRFAYRRFDEACKVIQSAVNNKNSGNLKPNEYYEELLYLADFIKSDKIDKKNKFTGEIWAMTGFADEEWIADEGYERLWTVRLKELIDEHGIKTRRLCLLPDSVFEIVSAQPFQVPSEEEHRFWGFVEFLKSYYSDEKTKKMTEHYLIRERDNPNLDKIKGFFAIKLTSGDLHILYGETVDSNGALTAQVLFDPEEIQEVRRLFELYTRPNYKLEKKLKEIAGENGLIPYLQNNGILI